MTAPVDTGAAPVLVVGPSWIGDMVMAQSLCATLRSQHPGLAVDMLAPGWSLPVIGRMPGVRDALESPFAHAQFDWRGRHGLGRALRDRGYGRAIVLPRSFKSALAPFHARIPVRTGYRGEMRFGLINDMRSLDRTRLPRTVDRYVALGLAAGASLPSQLPHPRLRIDAANQAAVLQRLGLSRPDALVGLVPGAEYGAAKQWPAASFGELARRLNQDGTAVWVFGSDKERALGDSIARAAGPATINLCGRTTLPDAIDLIALAGQVVTNDSGLMHVAAATGVPVVAIYGSSSPDFTPPLSDRATIAWLGIECSPCFERSCRFGHYRCLREITPAQILQAMRGRGHKQAGSGNARPTIPRL